MKKYVLAWSAMLALFVVVVYAGAVASFFLMTSRLMVGEVLQQTGDMRVMAFGVLLIEVAGAALASMVTVALTVALVRFVAPFIKYHAHQITGGK